MTLVEQLVEAKLYPFDDQAACLGGHDLPSAWAVCGRGDWMLRLAAWVDVDRRLLVQAACDCAETALCHLPAGEGRPKQAIEAARAWCRGELTAEQVRATADAAYQAYATYDDTADYVACHVVFAACAAASLVYGRADDAAAYSDAASASAYDAALAADDPAGNARSLRRCADLVRARIPVDVVAAALATKVTR